MVCTSACARSAISASRCPNRPNTGTRTRSPGRTSDTIAASIPARDVPSTSSGRLVGRREDLAVQRHRLVHVPGHHRVVLADQRRGQGAQHARVGVDRPGTHEQAGGRVHRGGHAGPPKERARRTRDRSLPRGPTRQTPTGAGPSADGKSGRGRTGRAARRCRRARSSAGWRRGRGRARRRSRCGPAPGRAWSAARGRRRRRPTRITAASRSTSARADGLVRGGHVARDREPLAHAGSDRVGVRGDPGAVRPPRLGGLHHAERLEPLVERTDLDLLDACPRARPSNASRVAGSTSLQDLDGHDRAATGRGGASSSRHHADDRLERRAVAGQPADRVERRRERQHALPRHQPVRRAQPPEALVARRDADRPGGVAGQAHVRLPGGDRGRRAAGRAARERTRRRRRWRGCRSAGWRPRSSRRARRCGPGRAPRRRP